MTEVSDTHGTIYHCMEVIEEGLNSENSAHIDLGLPVDNLHYDGPSVEADPRGIAAFSRFSVHASIMGDQGDTECTICKVNVHLLFLL